jgi:glycosyltransferase involved in cell wall biosynthesis
MQNPIVSFVVPCYKLSHLLPECLNSIFRQTYSDFEVLIMDDCSPDDTSEVAALFRDQRVRYVRNKENLGHLQNFNKGITLSRGKYVWLISADDYLRSPDVLQRYVGLMDKYPNVGYTFCPGFTVESGIETHIIGCYSALSQRDRVIPGHLFLKKLLRRNFILAASAMARRECYEKIGLFPLDLPWAHDLYLWCLFALHYDVGYLAEPMVGYRKHELSITNVLFQTSPAICCEADIAVAWRIKQKADEMGLGNVSRKCLDAVSEVYARDIASERYGMSRPALTLEEFERSLCTYTAVEAERDRVRTRVYGAMGNEYYWQDELALAKEYYERALKRNPWIFSTHAKRFLLYLGKRGDYVRRSVLSFRGITRNRPVCL